MPDLFTKRILVPAVACPSEGRLALRNTAYEAGDKCLLSPSFSTPVSDMVTDCRLSKE
jgi:hypothetical protein